MEKQIIEETDEYTFYERGSQKVFELKNFNDHMLYLRGIKEGRNRYWRQHPVTNEINQKLNEFRSRDFIVKYEDQESSPVAKGL